jgi:hypothetical protein
MTAAERPLSWRFAAFQSLPLVLALGCGLRNEPAPNPVDQGPLITPNPQPVTKSSPTASSIIPSPGAGPAALPAPNEMLEPGQPRRQRTGFEQWTVAQTALDALIRIGQPAVPSLIALLKEPDPRLRGEAVVALSRIGPEAQAAVPQLTALAQNDPDEAIRKSAVRALGQIGPAAASAVPVLIEKLENEASDSDRSPRIPSRNRPFSGSGVEEG